MATTMELHATTETAELPQLGKDEGAEIVAIENNQEKVRNEEHQKDDSGGIRGWYSRQLVKLPVAIGMCVCLLALTAVCGVVSFVVYDPPSFDQPTKGFEARGTDINARMLSFNNLNEALRSVYLWNSSSLNLPGQQLPEATNATTDGQTRRKRRDANNTDEASGVEFCSWGAGDFPAIVFEAVGDHELFTREALVSICTQYDDNIGSTSQMELFCCRKSNGECSDAESLGHYVALLNGRESCQDIQESDVSNVKMLLKTCAPYYRHNALKFCQDGSSDCPPDVPAECVSFDHAVYSIFQYLVPAAFVEKASVGDVDLSCTILFIPYSGYNREIYESTLQGKDINDGVTVAVALGFGSLKFNLFSDYLLSDTLYIGLGACFVFVIIWVYTGSLIITFMSIMSMLMSLVMAYFTFVVVFRMPFFPFVNVASAVLIIGIGADDTFVYVDIWRQMKSSHVEAPPSVVLRETLHHAAVTMFVTSFTTSSALFCGVVSSITAVRCFGVYAGTAILINFIFTLTWLPAAVIFHSRFQAWCATLSHLCPGILKKLHAAHSLVAEAYRRVFEHYLPLLVISLRYVWIVLLASLGVGAFCLVYVTPKLRLPTSAEFQVFQDSDLFELYDNVYKPKFYFNIDEADPLFISFVFGVEALDNGDHWDPDDSGTPILIENFNMSGPQAQEWLLEFCHDFHDQKIYGGQSESSECFMDSFQRLMEAPCSDGTIPCCGQTVFPYPAGLFETCLKASRRCDVAAPYGCEDYGMYPDPGPLFSRLDGSIRGFMMYDVSSKMDTMDFNSINAFWTEANEWFDKALTNKPAEITGGWLYAGSTSYSGGQQLYFYNLQRSLSRDTPVSMGLSLAIAAAVLLLTTWNLLVSLYAMLSIAGAFCVTVGTLVLLDWRLNIFESAILSLAVGLSVDFTIHYGVAYRLATSRSRKDRTMTSLTTVSSAITVAALSTFVAGAMMMPSSVLTYIQLGIFLMLVMAVSWVFATFFFLSLCRVIGPQGNCAQVPFPGFCFKSQIVNPTADDQPG